MEAKKLPITWRWSTLGEMADPHCRAIVSGPFGSNIGSRFFVSHGVPVIRGNNLTTDMTRFIDDGFVYVTDEKARELANCDAIPGDLLITAAGSLGQIGIIPKDARFASYIISNKQMRARVNREKLDPLFAFYWFSSPNMVSYIQRRNTGSSVPLINLSILRSLPIPIPPLAEQHAILRVLDTLDAKIELNRRTNETLEAMARALFKSWFVDFDPVRAKAERRMPAGMDAELVTLFPAEFAGSDLGPIPRGWRVTSVGDLVDLQRGTTYKSALKGTPGPVLLGLGAIARNGGFRDEKLATYGGPSPEKLLLHPGDLFVSLKDVTQSADLLGAVARVPPHVPCGRLTQDTVKLVIKGSDPIENVLYQTLLSPGYREYCRGHATGTTNLGLSREDFFAFPIVIAPPPILSLFNKHVSALERQAQVCVAQSRTLTALRDSLLPRLLSGEISVAHAERAAEAAT